MSCKYDYKFEFINKSEFKSSRVLRKIIKINLYKINKKSSEIEDMGAEALAISILTTDNISELYIDFKKYS